MMCQFTNCLLCLDNFIHDLNKCILSHHAKLRKTYPCHYPAALYGGDRRPHVAFQFIRQQRYPLGWDDLHNVDGNDHWRLVCVARPHAVRAVRKYLRPHRSGDSGSVGPDQEADCVRSLSPRPQPDDHQRGNDVDRAGTVLGFMDHRLVGRDIHRHQPCLFYFVRRARAGKTIWGKLSPIQSQRPPLDSTPETVERVKLLPQRHEDTKGKGFVPLSLLALVVRLSNIFQETYFKQKEWIASRSNPLFHNPYSLIPTAPTSAANRSQNNLSNSLHLSHRGA